VEEVLEREKGALQRERDVSGRSSNRRGGMAFGVGGGALGLPRVMRKRVWTWAKKWSGWMALRPIWFGPLLKLFFLFKIFWYYILPTFKEFVPEFYHTTTMLLHKVQLRHKCGSPFIKSSG